MYWLVQTFHSRNLRLLSNYSQDENMINAYKQGKDLYATIASGVYKNTYWDNMEHYEDGTPNPEGKKRRSSVKSLLLGIMYGRGVASIAEQIGGTTKDAQKIIDDFYSSFPKVKNWMDDTLSGARENGYVEDLWGRRRRLPDIKLDKYSIKFKDNRLNVNTDFNPLLRCKGLVGNVKSPLIEKYEKLTAKCQYKDEIDKVVKEAESEGIVIKNNGMKISQAERQCVNARVQGGAATMSKKAMIKVDNDEVLKNLGFKLMLAVHDELIGECPEENANEVAERLCDIMKIAAEPECVVPFKCDPTIEKSWYYTDYSEEINKTYKGLIKGGKTEEESFYEVCKEYSECTPEDIKVMIGIN